jgi:hypothetical protein
MSGLVTAFIEVPNRDALLMDIVDRGAFNGVLDLGVEYLSNEPEVVYLELMTRPVIDGHPGPQTICSSADEGIGTPSGPSRTTLGKYRSLRPASSMRRRRRGQSGCTIAPIGGVDLHRADVATGVE